MKGIPGGKKERGQRPENLVFGPRPIEIKWGGGGPGREYGQNAI